MMATEYRDPRDKDQDDTRDPRNLGGPNPDIRDARLIGDDRDIRLAGDVRDVRTLVDLPDSRWIRHVLATMVSTVYILLGASLLLEPKVWDRTPAYAVLLDLFPQRVWGLILIGVAAVLVGAVWLINSRLLSRLAHLAAILFTSGWAFAFLVRWATDAHRSTTPMNAAMWTFALGVLVVSLRASERYWASITTVGHTE